MKYLYSFFAIGSLTILILGVLGIEQVYGLPLLFLSLSTLWLEKRNRWRQLVYATFLGIALGTVYFFSYSLGFLLIIGSVWVFNYLRSKLASQTTALLLTSIGAGFICSGVTQIFISWPLVISCAASVLCIVLLSKITLTHHTKRYHL